MEFDGEVIKFNIFDAMRFPADVSYVYALDVIAELPQDIYDLSNEDECLTVLTKSLDHAEFQKVPYQINDELLEEIQLEDPGASWSRANDYQQRCWLGGNPTFLDKYPLNFAFIFILSFFLHALGTMHELSVGGASYIKFLQCFILEIFFSLFL